MSNTRLNSEDGYDAARRGEHTSRLETRLEAEAADSGEQQWLAAQADGSVAVHEGEPDAAKLGVPRAHEHENEIDRLRKLRLAQLKGRAAARQSWLALGHGKYVQLESEEQFVQANASGLHARLVCAVVADGSLDGQLLSAHMRALAEVHVETYFVCLRAEAAPMMMEMVRAPTLALALTLAPAQPMARPNLARVPCLPQVDFARLPALLLCADGKVVHQLHGIDRSFTTEGVAYHLGEHKVR